MCSAAIITLLHYTLPVSDCLWCNNQHCAASRFLNHCVFEAFLSSVTQKLGFVLFLSDRKNNENFLAFFYKNWVLFKNCHNLQILTTTDAVLSFVQYANCANHCVFNLHQHVSCIQKIRIFVTKKFSYKLHLLLDISPITTHSKYHWYCYCVFWLWFTGGNSNCLETI